MRFVHLANQTAVSGQESRALDAERRAGRRIGVVTLGARDFFFRRGLTAYYIPYADIRRYFRRVLAIPARVGCCTGGELHVEHIVVCGDGGRELAQIQLPGERAALALMDQLHALAPNAAVGRPSADTEATS